MLRQAALGENGAGAEALRNSLLNTWLLAESPSAKVMLGLAGMALENPAALDFLRTGKREQLKKAESPEYLRMRESLQKLQQVPAILDEGDPGKIETLYGRDLEEELAQAKEACFQYLRIKTKNGLKRVDSFHYESGKARAMESLQNYEKLCAL